MFRICSPLSHITLKLAAISKIFIHLLICAFHYYCFFYALSTVLGSVRNKIQLQTWIQFQESIRPLELIPNVPKNINTSIFWVTRRENISSAERDTVDNKFQSKSEIDLFWASIFKSSQKWGHLNCILKNKLVILKGISILP